MTSHTLFYSVNKFD